MAAKSSLYYLRMAPRKVRLVADLVRGKPVDKALTTLMFVPRSAAEPVAKVIRSAVANASETEGLDTDRLFVKRIWVDEGPHYKRFMPRAQGRAFQILKRSSHLHVELAER